MPLDSFIDSPFHPLPPPPPRNPLEYRAVGNDNGPNNVQYRSYAPFKDAREFVIQNATMIERAEYSYSIGRSVLEILHPYTNPDAAVDSSARDPPPKCHPGTRVHILEQLEEWLESPSREHQMLWLHGPAGTGKSAVAQTFAETCAERDRLGAAFFFSRPNRRDKPKTVIPSLAYQLAFYCPEYKLIIGETLADDPQLLRKAIHVQFKRFITEPFSKLQARGHVSSRQPFLVLLDGLDECAGARAQCEFVKMISELARLKHGFPILWLLCSRPESHLKHAFSRTPECGRLELLLDEGSREDVERFLRDSFTAIRDSNPDVIPAGWPSEDQLSVILRVSSGLFVVASVSLRYVDNPVYELANPVEQLQTLVSYLGHSERVGIGSPLAALDFLYLQILSDVPNEVLPVTRRILVHLAFRFLDEANLTGGQRLSAQAACNMLQFDQSTFYNALRCLHSVLEVPSAEDAAQKRLQFYHTSFHDFLLDSNRSGSFSLKARETLAVEIKTYMLWHHSDHSAHHRDVQIQKHGFVLGHKLGSYPSLTWALPTDQNHISAEIADFVYSNIWFAFGHGMMSSTKNEDLLTYIREFDFRCAASYGIDCLARWISFHHPSSDIVRTKSSSDIDSRLLGYLHNLNTITDQCEPVMPANVALDHSKWEIKGSCRDYFLLGCGQKAVLVLRAIERLEADNWSYRTDMWGIDNPPSEQFLADHRTWLDSVASKV